MRPAAAAADATKPVPLQEHPSQATLALLLHQTTLERDEARAQWESWKDRAERAESLLLRLDAHQTPPSANSAHHSQNGPNAHDSKTAAPPMALLLQIQAQLDATKLALAKSEGRFRAVFDAWDNFEKWQIECERRVLDARVNIRSVISSLCDPAHHELPVDQNSPHPKPPYPQHHRAPPAKTPLAPAGFPTLPPPPSVSSNRVRARTESVESERAAKRPRPEEQGVSPTPADHSAMLRPRPSSPSIIPALHLPVPPVVSGRSHLPSHTRNNMLPPIHPQRGYGTETPEQHTADTKARPQVTSSDPASESFPEQRQAKQALEKTRNSGSSHSRENSGSNLGEIITDRKAGGGDDDAASESGNSIDEMILEASSTHQPAPGTAPNPRVNSRGGSSHPGDVPESATLGASPGVATPSTSTGATFTINATSTPVKKPKGAKERVVEPVEVPAQQVIYPATNEQGQRTCRQCGQAGRYKDGKCVEKWGPGPLGPGTVCDRCRKKMKRIERRGQADAVFQSALQANIASHTPASANSSTSKPGGSGAKRNMTDSDSEDFPSMYSASKAHESESKGDSLLSVPKKKNTRGSGKSGDVGTSPRSHENLDTDDVDADGVADADGDAETDADADGVEADTHGRLKGNGLSTDRHMRDIASNGTNGNGVSDMTMDMDHDMD